MSETATRSREEDEELQRSTKKVKENHSLGSPQTDTPPPPNRMGICPTKKSYLEKSQGPSSQLLTSDLTWTPKWNQMMSSMSRHSARR